MSEPHRISPADMAHRRPPAERVTPPPRPVRFVVSATYPRRGRRDAVTWVDTGIFLSIGKDQSLIDRFATHFGAWLQTSAKVVREVISFSEIEDVADTETDHDRRSWASRVRTALLLGGTGRVQVRTLQDVDLPLRDEIVNQLRGLSSSGKSGHGGEAELIALAVLAARNAGAAQVLLSNDAGASVVADARGIVTRHMADVLRELLCADPALPAAELFAHYQGMLPVSSVERSVIATHHAELACQRSGVSCGICIATDSNASDPNAS